MASLLGALVTPAEGPTCTPITHTAGHNCLQLQFLSIYYLPLASSIVAHIWHTQRQSGQSPHKYNLKRNKMSLILFISGKLNHNGDRPFLADFIGRMSHHYFCLGHWLSINQSSHSPSFLCLFSFLLQTPPIFSGFTHT